MRRRRGGREEERGKSGGGVGREWEACCTETGSAAITDTCRTDAIMADDNPIWHKLVSSEVLLAGYWLDNTTAQFSFTPLPSPPIFFLNIFSWRGTYDLQIICKTEQQQRHRSRCTLR